MAYFKIGDKDFSNYCQELTIKYRPLYNSQTNAAGNTVVDMINTKRTIEVTFRPMNNTEMAELLNAVSQFDVSISYREPKTNVLVSNIGCLVDDVAAEYYTIQANKVLYNTTKLIFEEL